MIKLILFSLLLVGCSKHKCIDNTLYEEVAPFSNIYQISILPNCVIIND